MPILNYTTNIKPEKTIGEIQMMLSKNGASKITVDYDDGIPSGVTFMLTLRDRYIPYALPCNYEGVLAALDKDQKVPERFVTKEQAVKVSWRIVKDWVEAQMAIVQAGLATIPEIFLPYAITNKGITLYEHFLSDDGIKLLEHKH